MHIARKLLAQAPQNQKRQEIVQLLENPTTASSAGISSKEPENHLLETAVRQGNIDQAKHLQEQGARLNPDILKTAENEYPNRIPDITMLLQAQVNQTRLTGKDPQHNSLVASTSSNRAENLPKEAQEIDSSPICEVAGDAYPRQLELLAQLGYNELFADTGADLSPVSGTV